MSAEERTAASHPRTVEVVHLIGALDIGGAETVALDLCRSVPAAEFRQTFVCLSGRRGQLAGDFEAAGARVVTASLKDIGFVVRLRHILKGPPSADVVVAHVSLASAPLLVLARICGVRTRVARFHSQADGRGSQPSRRVYRSVMRLLVALSATHVLGVSESSLAFGLGRFRRLAVARGGEVDVVPNGVDTDTFRPGPEALPETTLVVVHVGRASPEKNRAALVPILRSLRETGPASIRVVGSSSHEDLGPDSGELTVVGPTRDVPTELRRGHVLVLPSTWEGLPTVVLEALSCDVPVVASDLPGIAEIARGTHGVTLVPASAPPDVWATALRRAASSNGRGIVRNGLLDSPFTLERSSTTWRHIWRGGGNRGAEMPAALDGAAG